jgi:hypothetical protein
MTNKRRNFLKFGSNYSGKISRNFINFFCEELQSFRYCNYNSKFAHNPLENGHQTGNIDNITKKLHAAKENGAQINTNERFYLYTETKKDNQLNDMCVIRSVHCS